MFPRHLPSKLCCELCPAENDIATEKKIKINKKKKKKQLWRDYLGPNDVDLNHT